LFQNPGEDGQHAGAHERRAADAAFRSAGALSWRPIWTKVNQGMAGSDWKNRPPPAAPIATWATNIHTAQCRLFDIQKHSAHYHIVFTEHFQKYLPGFPGKRERNIHYCAMLRRSSSDCVII
jgi:hypothetical protein